MTPAETPRAQRKNIFLVYPNLACPSTLLRTLLCVFARGNFLKSFCETFQAEESKASGSDSATCWCRETSHRNGMEADSKWRALSVSTDFEPGVRPPKSIHGSENEQRVSCARARDDHGGEYISPTKPGSSERQFGSSATAPRERHRNLSS
jgi:hypothetical protein